MDFQLYTYLEVTILSAFEMSKRLKQVLSNRIWSSVHNAFATFYELSAMSVLARRRSSFATTAHVDAAETYMRIAAMQSLDMVSCCLSSGITLTIS